MSTRRTSSLLEADSAEMANRPTRSKRWLAFAAVLGPGLMAMMADTDVGSVVTAAQSGAQWGFALLPLEFLLIPVLYIVQELTVRLGIFTGVGHGELICRHCGRKWGWISISGLIVAVFGAMITEFSGIAGVGDLLGIPRGVSLSLATLLLLAVVGLGSYRRVEKTVLVLSLFELAFLWTALKAQPHFSNVAELRMPLDNFDFRYLIAANIGAVIMPWMIFFQQSAVVDKRLRPKDLHHARWDTALGAVLTQAIMAAVLITAAVALRTHGDSRSLNTVGEITEALVPVLGSVGGRWIFSIGITGAAFVALLVTALAAAWGLGEMTGFEHSLEKNPREAPWFYGTYAAAVIGSAVVVDRVRDLVALNVSVEVMNALLLPLVLGFLVYLAVRVLPARHRLRGVPMWIAISTCAVTSGIALWCVISGLF